MAFANYTEHLFCLSCCRASNSISGSGLTGSLTMGRNQFWRRFFFIKRYSEIETFFLVENCSYLLYWKYVEIRFVLKQSLNEIRNFAIGLNSELDNFLTSVLEGFFFTFQQLNHQINVSFKKTMSFKVTEKNYAPPDLILKFQSIVKNR